MLATPWVLVAVLEAGLRVAGYGGDYPLFVAAPHQPEYLMPNPEVGRRYFGYGPFAPTPAAEFFRARKAPNTYRIIFQGESSAQGFPYGHGGMPSRMLEQRLQATFPAREIEVVNVALTAINSHALLDQAAEVVAQQPDAVLIYTGHNEYYGVFGPGSHGLVTGRPVLVRTWLSLRRLRIVQLIENAIATIMPKTRPGDEPPRTVMQLMAGEQRVPRRSPRYVQGLQQFRANLRDLLSLYRAGGIPVFIGTVASNERDQPPLGASDSIGADSADVYFAVARRLEEGGDIPRARGTYREAKERDPLRFRAPEAINRIIREEAARQGATVVETQSALERASPGGVVGHAVMLEHVHPNLGGYFLIADAFYEAMRQRRMIGEWTDPITAADARRSIAVTPLDSLVGIFRTNRLVSAWPFRPRGQEQVPIVDTLRPKAVVEQLARAVVVGQLPWPEATERLRASAERSGDHALAARAALAMAQEFSYSPEPLLDLARIAAARGDDGEVLRYARAAQARQETSRGAEVIGMMLLRRGDHAGAMPHLKRAAELAPGDRRILALYSAAGALPDLEDRRARTPRDTTALYNLAIAYALTEQEEKARATLAELQRVSPTHAGARDLLDHLSRD